MDFTARYKYNPKTDLLGRGGFSKVYKATDTLLKRTVALKIFSLDSSDKYDVLADFRRVINFEHANLCRYYDVAFFDKVNTADGPEKCQVGIMEYLDGGQVGIYRQK